nr:transglutaminaseTgpA domain-containing protein [Micromonospora sp. DSM 115978]
MLGLLGLVVTVTALSDARADAFAGVLPTPSALAALGDLIVSGTDDIAQLAAPVPQRPGLVVLTVVGVYVVVLIVDVLVVGLGRPTLAGLPLLGLFAVPAAVLDGGVGIVPFLLGAVGFLLLLVIDGHESA